MDERVAIRAHFERFPATVKGAFVMRGGDGNPHQLAVREARVQELSGAVRNTIALDAVILEVAPTLDLFVPFEFSVLELPSGWYGLELEAMVDGTPAMYRPGNRFAIPWPRASTRRGSVVIGKAIEAGGGKVRLGQLDCAVDCIRLSYEAPEPPLVELAADGHRLPVLEVEHDRETGQGRIVAYPMLKAHSVLEIQIAGAEGPLELRLP